nr:Thiamine-binding periplasmic protein precursor [Klebsiella pneumoniae]
MPGGWDNDTFVPYDYGYFAFVYDKTNWLIHRRA